MIDPKDTPLGSKKRANKQYRCSSLHIRGFGTHHTVYMDRVDPLSSPLGHLLVDAPEYLAGATATFIVGRRLSTTVYNICKKESKSTKDAAIARFWLNTLPAPRQATLFSRRPARWKRKGVSKLDGEPGPDQKRGRNSCRKSISLSAPFKIAHR
jgi:hypothetical protein